MTPSGSVVAGVVCSGQSPNAKVLGFDAWTKGIHHYQRLIPAFRNCGLEFLFVHLGSWGNEVGRAAEEVIGNVQVRDISFYHRQSLSEILELEKPDVVVFLSTEAFAHRAFNRYCRHYRVPTVHVFHGLQGTVNSEDDLKIQVHKRMWMLRGHISKLLTHYLPVYARSLLYTRASSDDWYQFGEDIIGRFLGRHPKVVGRDSKADRACVYIESEIDHAIERYGYSKSEVSAVGNPDLAFFGVSPGAIGSFLHRPSNHEKVMYVASGLVDGGYVYESQNEFVDHIVQTSRELLKQGKRPILKPHPIHVGSGVLDRITQAGVGICSNEEFIGQLQECCACIVEPTSAALIPALMGMPVFLAQFGSLRSHHFGELLASYPRAIPFADAREFSSLLMADQARSRLDETRTWIDRNTGPLPAEDLPNRVAEIVLSLCSSQVGARR